MFGSFSSTAGTIREHARNPSASASRKDNPCARCQTTAVLDLPAVKDKFAPQGIEPMPMTPTEFDTLVVKEIAANHAIVKAAGLKFN